MSSNPRKRQKHLERRAAKRKEKKHDLARTHQAGLPERLSAASKYPILNCRMPDSMEENGIGWVLLSRALPNGTVAAATFLVDRYCLGVKNVFAEILPRVSYDTKYVRKMRTDMPGREIPPAEARRFIEKAVAYAHGLGFGPHPDYERAMLLFGDVDSSQSDAEFEFGKDGKPFYVSGPNETPERSRQIIATLNHTCGGPGNFHFMIRVDPHARAQFAGRDQEFMPDSEDDEDDQ